MKTTIDFQTRLRIHELIKMHLKQIAPPSDGNSGGVWKYDEGFSDAQVAQIIGGKCQNNHVQYVRMASFGILERKIPDAQAAMASKGERAERLARLVIERFNTLARDMGVSIITPEEIAQALKG